MRTISLLACAVVMASQASATSFDPGTSPYELGNTLDVRGDSGHSLERAKERRYRAEALNLSAAPTADTSPALPAEPLRILVYARPERYQQEGYETIRRNVQGYLEMVNSAFSQALKQTGHWVELAGITIAPGLDYSLPPNPRMNATGDGLIEGTDGLIQDALRGAGDPSSPQYDPALHEIWQQVHEWAADTVMVYRYNDPGEPGSEPGSGGNDTGVAGYGGSGDFIGIMFSGDPLVTGGVVLHELGHGLQLDHTYEANYDPQHYQSYAFSWTCADNNPTVMHERAGANVHKWYSDVDQLVSGEPCGDAQFGNAARRVRELLPTQVQLRPSMESHGAISITASSVEVDEAAGEIDVVVARDGDLSKRVGVRVQSLQGSGTAERGEDFGALDTLVMFVEGQSVVTLTVPVLATDSAKANRSFQVALADPYQASLVAGSESVRITIQADEGYGDSASNEGGEDTPPAAGDSPSGSSGGASAFLLLLGLIGLYVRRRW